MDPITGSLIGGGLNLLGSIFKPSGNGGGPLSQRADGSAYGGMVDTKNSGGATGGAYGGAFSFGGVDGSNWNVSTSGANNSLGGGKSGSNSQIPSLNAPATQNPFQGITGTMAGSNGGTSSGHYLLIGLAVLAYVILHKG